MPIRQLEHRTSGVHVPIPTLPIPTVPNTNSNPNRNRNPNHSPNPIPNPNSNPNPLHYPFRNVGIAAASRTSGPSDNGRTPQTTV